MRLTGKTERKKEGDTVLKRQRIARLLLAQGILVFVFVCFLRTAAGENKIIRVAYNENAAPYAFTDEDGVPKGLFVDFMNRIGEYNGLEIEYCRYPGYSACHEALKNGEVRVVLGTIAPISTSEFASTSTLMASSLCLVTAKGNEKLYADGNIPAGASFVYEYGTAATNVQATLKTRTFILKGNQLRLLEAVTNGEADAALMIEDCYEYLARDKEFRDKFEIVRRNIGTANYVLLLRSNDYSLRQQLDSGVIKLHTSGAYEEFVKKWITTGGEEAAWIRPLLWITAGVAALTGLAFIISFQLMGLLKRKVAEKTQELETANLALDEEMRTLANENRLRKEMIERSRSGMLIIDVDEHVTLINNTALRFAGEELQAVGDPVGVNISAIPFWNEVYARLKSGTRAEKGGTIPEILNVERGGEKRKYRCYIAEGSAVNKGALLIVAEDITAEEKEKRALFEKEKNRYLNRLIAGIAHEVRNPLASIKTSAYLMHENPDDAEVKEAFATYVPGEVERISQLIDSLIQYARPYKGSPERFDISALLEECLYPAKIEAKKYPIRIRIDTVPGMFIFADRDRIKQSIINIILNGIESMEKKIEGTNASLTLTLSDRDDGETVSVRIRDEGEGMDDRELRKCLEPFFTTKQTGTGLGLTIVNQYLMENGGKMSIESKKGEYTEITLVFRKEDDHEKEDPDCR